MTMSPQAPAVGSAVPRPTARRLLVVAACVAALLSAPLLAVPAGAVTSAADSGPLMTAVNQLVHLGTGPPGAIVVV